MSTFFGIEYGCVLGVGLDACITCSLSHCRKAIAKLLEETHEHLYQANHTWIKSIRRQLRKSLIDGLAEEYNRSKQLSFLSFPVPECSCMKQDSSDKSFRASSPSPHSKLSTLFGVMQECPAWMDGDTVSQLKEKEGEEEFEEDESQSSGLFFEQSSSDSQVGGGGEINSKEDTQMEDNEELEGGER